MCLRLNKEKERCIKKQIVGLDITINYLACHRAKCHVRVGIKEVQLTEHG